MRFNKLDLNLLVAFDALVGERSITRAAAKLNLTPSATSSALARLRAYFDDELLVQVGRKMEPTPLADGLRDEVRDLLVRVENVITVRPQFEPATSERSFKLYTSDYTQIVLGPTLMRQVAAAGFGGTINFLPQVARPQQDLERGDADLLVMPDYLLSPEHPHELLWEEAFVCLVWSGSVLARGSLTRERYLQAGHVVMRPALSREPSYEEAMARRDGLLRRVSATTFGFATIPPLVVGTDLIATVQSRLAHALLPSWPLIIRPCPVPPPTMRQVVQWHRHRSKDPGLAWVRGLCRRAAQGEAEAGEAKPVRPSAQ